MRIFIVGSIFLTLFLSAFVMGENLPVQYCRIDSDCVKLGPEFNCISQKTGCRENPSTSTCVERICRKVELKQSIPILPHSIETRHRACEKDSDCEVILLSCRCMYCARPADKENGVVDAVNKKFSKQFEALSKCSVADCATAGACAMAGKSIPVCQKRECTVVYKPISR